MRKWGERRALEMCLGRIRRLSTTINTTRFCQKSSSVEITQSGSADDGNFGPVLGPFHQELRTRRHPFVGDAGSQKRKKSNDINARDIKIQQSTIGGCMSSLVNGLFRITGQPVGVADAPRHQKIHLWLFLGTKEVGSCLHSGLQSLEDE